VSRAINGVKGVSGSIPGLIDREWLEVENMPLKRQPAGANGRRTKRRLQLTMKARRLQILYEKSPKLPKNR
jgi:hypothetical protein